VKRQIRRPSPAMVVACIALAVALGGTSYAAARLPRNSVGTPQLKKNAVTWVKLGNNSVTSVKVKNHSLRAIDFARDQLPAGPAGPPGPAGAAGPAGPAGAAGPAGPGAKWALVRPDGGIVAQSGGISLTAHPSAGEYVLDFGSEVSGKLIIATSALASDSSFRGVVSAGPCGGANQNAACPVGNDTKHVHIFTDNPGETATQNHSFYVAVIG
jgi:hypothetical protein